MRLIILALVGSLPFWPSLLASPPPLEREPTAEVLPPADAETDVLGEVLVEAKPQALQLPRISVQGPEVRDGFDAQLADLVARDLDLSGQFAMVKGGRPAAFADPFAPDPWLARKVEAVVRSEATLLDGGRIQLRVALYLPDVGEEPAAIERVEVGPEGFRRAGHQLVDRVIRHLTGYDGPFDSRLLVVAREGNERRLYLVDADGWRLEAVSPREHTVIAAAFGPDGVPYWAGGPRGAPYHLYRHGQATPIPVQPTGSIYGVAYDRTRDLWALSVARGAAIQLFEGELGPAMRPVRQADFALAPTYAPGGALYWSETSGRSTRVRGVKRRFSPAGVSATRPTLCRGPEGDWLVMQINQGRHGDLARVSPSGSALERIGSGNGQSFSPACSPDGRLVAYVSRAKGGDGPGVYLARVDGRRPRKLLTIQAEELYWVRVPRAS